MPRYASTIRFTSADGETEVDFSGCKGYILDGQQFMDDAVRESKIVAAEGTPHFQGLVMNVGDDDPHRGNMYGVSMESVAADKVSALYLLNAAMKIIDSHMLVYLQDAVVNLNGVPSKADPDANPFWLATGRESEGMISDVVVRLIAR